MFLVLLWISKPNLLLVNFSLSVFPSLLFLSLPAVFLPALPQISEYFWQTMPRESLLAQTYNTNADSQASCCCSYCRARACVCEYAVRVCVWLCILHGNCPSNSGTNSDNRCNFRRGVTCGHDNESEELCWVVCWYVWVSVWHRIACKEFGSEISKRAVSSCGAPKCHFHTVEGCCNLHNPCISSTGCSYFFYLSNSFTNLFIFFLYLQNDAHDYSQLCVVVVLAITAIITSASFFSSPTVCIINRIVAVIRTSTLGYSQLLLFVQAWQRRKRNR